jgi:hypothetical protein
MGFNKRILDTEKIIQCAKNSEYNFFKNYIVNPDSLIFKDEFSLMIYNEFMTAKENEKVKIYINLKNEYE